MVGAEEAGVAVGDVGVVYVCMPEYVCIYLYMLLEYILVETLIEVP